MSAVIGSAKGDHNSMAQSVPLTETGGLPLELWRVILSYLPVTCLLVCSKVCKTWEHLVNSLDNTTWKRNFLANNAWKDPGWPLDEWDTHWTWQSLYHENQFCSQLWALPRKQINEGSTCLPLSRRRHQHKVLHVGAKQKYKTLKSALGVAGEYDCIMVDPGIYDEQFEMSSKIPFEIVGSGSFGSTVLIMCIEQSALTGRLSNLILRAPWFTSHVIKVISGHLQVDHCSLEDGHVIVHNPGTCHFRYCSFKHLQISFIETQISLIENCEFVHSTSTAVTVEGFPGGKTNWVHEHLASLISKQHETSLANSANNLSRSQSTLNEENASLPSENDSSSVEEDSIGIASIAGSQVSLSKDESLAPSFVSSVPSSASSRGHNSRPEDFYSDKSEVPVALLKIRGHIPLPAMEPSDSESTSSSESTTVFQLSGSCERLSTLWDDEEEKYMEEHLQSVLQDSVYADPSLVAIVSQTAGPVIRRCLFQMCHGGVAVSRQGQVRIERCHMGDVQYGIRSMQNAKVAVLENTIHHCSTSGIFMRLAAHGVIAGNDIYCTSEAGIDIRKGADPLVQCNKIHHCKRSGIVVLGGGHGTIKFNDIYQNREAGIYILYHSDPFISGNRIVRGGAAGIAISDEGGGYITENLISRNRWGGIDIRHNGNPCIVQNLICNGLADGIVIGQRGKGTIEGNTIKDNAGCGLWVMSGQPLIRLNQIYNNNNTGVSFVNSKDGSDDFSGDDIEDDLSDDSMDDDEEEDEEDQGDKSGTGSEPTHPQLLYNTIYHNKEFGILAQSVDAISISSNAVHANRSTGISILQSQPVTITDNSITCNVGLGVQVAALAKVQITGNGIYDNTSHGIQVEGEAEIHDNDIFSNQTCGIQLKGQADVEIFSNRIHAPDNPAVSISGQIKGHIYDNKMFEGQTEVMSITDKVECSVQRNDIIKHEKQNGCPGSKSHDWHLEDPAPRPHITAPPAIIPQTPIQHVTTVTKLVVPSSGSCQSGSKFCTIL